MAEAIEPEPWLAGWFNFYFADERWEWSPETERIHGYEPGTVTSTLEDERVTSWWPGRRSPSTPRRAC